MKTTIVIAMLILTSCGVNKVVKQTPQYRIDWIEEVKTDTGVVDTNYFYRSHQ